MYSGILYWRTVRPNTIFIQELKLGPQQNFKVCNYDRANTSNRYSGGLMILIKHSISHFETTIPQLSAIEALGITIIPHTQQPIMLVSIYLTYPPTDHKRIFSLI
ncbi:hypothetical protein X975_05416, partial [Stegodyphus mimosarum]